MPISERDSKMIAIRAEKDRLYKVRDDALARLETCRLEIEELLVIVEDVEEGGRQLIQRYEKLLSE